MVCAAGCTVLATGCLSPLEIRVAETDPGGWGSPATVAYDNRDTLSERTLYVTARLRNNFGYGYGDHQVAQPQEVAKFPFC